METKNQTVERVQQRLGALTAAASTARDPVYGHMVDCGRGLVDEGMKLHDLLRKGDGNVRDYYDGLYAISHSIAIFKGIARLSEEEKGVATKANDLANALSTLHVEFSSSFGHRF
jgi:hypothetical protein